MLINNVGLIITISFLLKHQISAQDLKTYEAIGQTILKYGEESKALADGMPKFNYVKNKLNDLNSRLQVNPDKLPEGKCDGLLVVITAIQALIVNNSLLLLIPAIPALFKAFEGPIKEFIDKISKQFNDFIFEVIARLISYGIPFLIKALLNGILGALQSIAKPLFDFLQPILGPLLSPVEPYLKPLFDALSNLITGAVTTIVNAISDILSLIIYAFIQLVRGLWNILSSLFSWLRGPFGFIIDPLVNLVTTIFDSLGKGIFTLLTNLGGGVNGIGQLLEAVLITPIRKALNL